ncbi:hypothetical protein ACH44C_34455 [Streptomyces purpureus]
MPVFLLGLVLGGLSGAVTYGLTVTGLLAVACGRCDGAHHTPTTPEGTR